MSDILVVEDSLTQAMRLKYLLEKNGRKVRVARDGLQALDELATAKPDIVITDVMMPKMNGYELCRTIKQDEALKEIPVVIVTTLSNPADVIKGLQCGANNFIIKPYEEQYLMSRLRHLEVNLELRKNRGAEMAMEVFFAGERHLVNSERMQIIDLLLSTFEMAVHQSQSLEVSNRELRNSLETIKALELNYRTLLEKSPDAIVVCDQNNVVRFANPSAEDLFGQSVDVIAGNRFDLNIAPGDNKEVTITRADGQTLVAQVWAVRTNWDGEDVCLASFRDVTERVRLHEELERLARTDSLTGINNRRGFFNAAESLMRLAQRLGKRLAFLFIDIDGFKRINDQFGHDLGDAMLQAFGAILREAFRESDVCGRIGGDEFAVLCMENEEMNLTGISTRLTSLVERYNRDTPSLPAPLAVSVGSQVIDSAERLTLEDLLRRSDALMYEHKRTKCHEE